MEYMQFIIIILFSPLIQGVIRETRRRTCRAGWVRVFFSHIMTSLRLFHKDMVVSGITSWIFKATPYIVFASTAGCCHDCAGYYDELPFWL